MRSADRRAGGRASVARQIENWIADYHALDGVPDEFIDSHGVARAHWVRFFVALARYSQKEIAQRFNMADRLVRETGMSYRVYGETSERSWPLGRLPLLIDAAEWRTIERGVIQRAELWDRVLADIYGEGRLVSDGVLPASAVLGSNDFVRPMHHVTPPGGRWLRFYAVDIGRGPDGRWWVLGDRAQAPSGAGYALENRVVFSRAFANLYRDLNVDRLAGFFREFRAGLAESASRSEPRIGLLTPGPYSQTYHEQAYLARYLGFLLVEGGDLVVRDDKVHVRTIAGLKRADVLWRRIDADWIDPLEMNAASRIGTPGMVDVIRKGGVVVANAPGSGLIESRSLLGYLPAIARRLSGAELVLPHIATWWCGDRRAARHVLDNFDDMAIASAFHASPPGLEQGRPAQPAEMSPERRDALRRAIERRGVDYVGQEIVKLSTTPTWNGGALAPRPFTLRVFAALTPEGWRVMPGGFCRISDNLDARALSMGEGVSSADVWVLEDKPVEMTTLLPRGDDVRIVRQLGNLPSRAADNLFWFGRYLERAEATLRLVRCFCARAVDVDTAGAAQARAKLQRLLLPRRIEGEDVGDRTPAEVASLALYEMKLHSSGAALAYAARNAAAIIRERLTQEIWQILGDLQDRLTMPVSPAPPEAELIDRAEGALHALAALSGLIQENFNRVAGWSFLDIGRRVERGIATCTLAHAFAERDSSVENLETLLDLIDSQITYRSRYLVGAALAPVRDMALLDPNNPRSVAFQVARISEHLSTLPTLRQDGMLEAPQRIARMLDAEIAVAEAAKLDGQKIVGFEQSLSRLAEAIEDRYFQRGSNAMRAETLKGLA
ncbi:MAG: circularly permuted type 2 ATP-grasp protein [Hyphomicrobiales bacterium]|nr:circularly permuted type 2 ATP-grasp protein [Hyphomicrobiales bacterium]